MNISPKQLQTLRIDNLGKVLEVKLTQRQVDVVACIIGGRNNKKIARLLDIPSYRTVDAHVRNILLAFECFSRDTVIDLVEKAGMHDHFKQHYENIKSKTFTSTNLLEEAGEDKEIPSSYLGMLTERMWINKRLLLLGIASSVGVICILSLVFFLDQNSIVSTNKPTLQTQSTGASSTWNLPLVAGHLVERQTLTDSIWKKLTNQKKNSILIGLHGLGGGGKTTLALDAIHNPKQKYEFRGWFSAEATDLLKAEYFDLGERFHLFSKNMSEQLKIKLVKEWIDKKESVLLVYDNAPDMEILKEFLPHKGHIIVTSRNYKLPEAIEVGVMTESEGLSLLENLIPLALQKEPSYGKQANELISVLGYLPLAISQAGGYINENSTALSSYLKMYKASREKLLYENSLPPGDQHEPTYITWEINTKTIQALPEGEKALDLLNFISYCYPENIPKKLLIQYSYGKVNEDTEISFNNALSLLRKYSLVKVSPDSVSIHRLVHDWVRHKHSDPTKLRILQKGMAAIKAVYPGSKKSTQDLVFIHYLFPHAESIFLQIHPLIKDINVVDLMSLLGDIYETLGNYGKSKNLFERTIDINRKHFGKSHIKTAKALGDTGRNQIFRGNYTEAETNLREALEILRQHHASRHIEMARVLNELGQCSLLRGLNKQAKEFLEESLRLREKYYGPHHMITDRALQRLGWAYIESGDFAKGKKMMEKALFINEKYYGPHHIETANALRNVAWTELYSSHYSKARSNLEKSLLIIRNHYGYGHIVATPVLNNLGCIYTFIGDYAKAKLILENLLKNVKRVYGSEHMEVATVLYTLGWTHIFLGQYNEAKELLEKALFIRKEFYGPEHIRVVRVLEGVAIVNCYLGNYNKSRVLMEEASRIATRNYGKFHEITAKANTNLGNIYRLVNKLDESQILLEESFSFLHEFYGPDHVSVAMSMANLGLLYGELGDSVKKREYLERALVIFKKHLYPENVYIKQTLDELRKMDTKTANKEEPKAKGYFIMY